MTSNTRPPHDDDGDLLELADPSIRRRIAISCLLLDLVVGNKQAIRYRPCSDSQPPEPSHEPRRPEGETLGERRAVAAAEDYTCSGFSHEYSSALAVASDASASAWVIPLEASVHHSVVSS